MLTTDEALGAYLNDMFGGEAIIREPLTTVSPGVERHQALACVSANPQAPVQCLIAALFLLGLLRPLGQGRLKACLLAWGQHYLRAFYSSPGKI